MVNIQSVVHIRDSTVISYNSCESYWAVALSGSDPVWKQKMLKLRALMIAAEKALAKSLKLPETHLENLCLVFGTAANTLQRMRDIATRVLVCNLEHKIVVQIRTNQDKCDVISTVYRSFDYQILTSSFSFIRDIPDSERLEP